MNFIEQIGYYGLHTLATPLLWWTITILAVLLYFRFFPVKRPRIRYYTTLGVILSLPIGFVLSFMPSSVYTTVTAPENMTWIAAPEITVTGSSDSETANPYSVAFWIGLVLMIAFASIVISLIRFSVSIVNLFTLRRSSKPVLNASCNRMICRLQSQLKISKPVQLMQNPLISSPVSFGWKMPVIVVPSSTLKQPSKKIEPVLLHELHHIKHSDFLISIIIEAVTSLVSFHPGTIMLRSRLYEYQEMHCDAMVLGRQSCNTADYAQILLDYSCGSQPYGGHLACTMSRSNLQIRERILMMNRYPEKEKSPDTNYSLLAPMIAFSLFLTATIFTSCDLTPDQLDDESDRFRSEQTGHEPTPVDGLNSILANLDVTQDDIEGDQIKVEVMVSYEGEIRDTYVEKSMGQTFDQAFIEAMRESEWQPAMRDGEPVDGYTTIGFNFDTNNQTREPEPVGGMDAIFENLEYPEEAQNAGIEGVVIVQFVVDREGNLSNMEILQEIGGGTSEAAKHALRNVEWEPGYEDGMPAEVTIEMPIRFQLES